MQDGKIVKIGQTERLGQFIQLRDAYGNTYTYAHLKKIAKRHPVPKAAPRRRAARGARRATPTPTQAASAGTQDKAAKAPLTPRATAQTPPAKERLFAQPTRPAAFKAGGKEQLDGQATASDLKLLGLPADQVEMKELKVGSRVVGGTILGRIGRTSMREAPHMRFEIRPAGRGAPRIDPKPILDGWKLLESTAVYRAKGRNPFFGPDATPSIGQILLMSKADLERRVLRNPRIEIYGGGRRDVRDAADRPARARDARVPRRVGPAPDGHLAGERALDLHRVGQRLAPLVGQRGRHREDQRHPGHGPPGPGLDHRHRRAPPADAPGHAASPRRSSR